MRPSASLRSHLTFHLKHEVLHLEMLSRVFSRVDTDELVAWVDDEPSGQYARKAGFLFEWLTGRQLEVNAPISGPYVDILDDRKLVAASADRSVTNRRWRVRDNLPGSPAFCPIIRKTGDFDQAVAVAVCATLYLNKGTPEMGNPVYEYEYADQYLKRSSFGLLMLDLWMIWRGMVVIV